jgi:threonine dehydrogenase-like Zn-dependent dehydrogenase
MPGMKEGMRLGHEFMGIVEEVGSEVTKLSSGQRVVVAFDIACGKCQHCLRGEHSGCETTNPRILVNKLYPNLPAMYGGEFEGGQAEYVRVRLAEFNCLPIPADVPDDKALYLSDILPTAWHATELGDVQEGDTVGIWGLGPVGLLTARWCQIRKAARIIGIDCVEARLDLARDFLGISVINFKEQNVLETLGWVVPSGLDVAIDCVGGSATIFTAMFAAVRNFGRVSVIGVYSGTIDQFPIGAMMEKGLTVRGGICPVQQYWKMILEKIRSGEMDPTFIITHRATLDAAPGLYKKFQEREDAIIKVFLRPMKFADE